LFANGDAAALRQLLPDDIVWHVPGPREVRRCSTQAAAYAACRR